LLPNAEVAMADDISKKVGRFIYMVTSFGRLQERTSGRGMHVHGMKDGLQRQEVRSRHADKLYAQVAPRINKK